MSDGRTYKEWPRFVEKKAREEWNRRADIKHIDWDDMISLSQRVSILMRYKDRSDEFKDGIMAKVYHYVTGIPQIDETMRMWQQAIDNIHSYMNANKNDKNMRVFDCQDIMLLLLTISAMYDGPYKNIINILYGASDDAGSDTMPLDKKAKHIAKRHGIDIQWGIFTIQPFRINLPCRSICVCFKFDKSYFCMLVVACQSADDAYAGPNARLQTKNTAYHAQAPRIHR